MIVLRRLEDLQESLEKSQSYEELSEAQRLRAAGA